MTKEKVMNSPEQKSHENRSKSRARTPAERPHKDDDQSQATVEDFDEEGMGVAPKE